MQGTVQDVTNGNRVEENLISANRLLDESLNELLSWKLETRFNHKRLNLVKRTL
jgi:hypothetical protein